MASLTSIASEFKKRLTLAINGSFLGGSYAPLPGGKELLDREYKEGIWDYLADIEELSRFSVINGYCNHFKKNYTVLEIGCGEGLLKERLCPSNYEYFLGIDISSEPVERAKLKEDAKSFFACADATKFVPDRKFDLIIFNECLLYIAEPAALMKRYEAYLDADGYFIVSMYKDQYSIKIWRIIDAAYKTITATRIKNQKGLEWKIKVIDPSLKK